MKFLRWLPPWHALLPPLAAFVVQWLCWSWLQPFVWFLFYPAVYFSSWIGGRLGGYWATALSTLLVWFFFITPVSFFAVQDYRMLVSMAVFIGMGVLFSLVHERVRRSAEHLAEALAAVRVANKQLEDRVLERTTELAASRESVLQSEARMAGIVSSAMDAIISVNSEQIIVLFNAAAEVMFRCSAADAMGQRLERFIPQRFRQAHEQHVEDFGKTGVTSRSMRSLGSLFGLRADGGEFPIEASISQTEVAGQKIFTVILRDITERTRNEAATALLAAIVESSSDAIVGKNLDSTVTSWNAGAESMFGYAAAEIIGRSITLIIPPDRQGEEEHILSRIKRGERVEHFETIRQTKAGGTIAVSVTVSPIRDAQGHIVGASKVARNITERQLAAKALQESKERLRIVTENARLGLVIISPERRYVYANGFYAEILGRPVSAIVGQNLADVLTTFYDDKIRALMDRAFAGERVTAEVTWAAPDGDRYFAVTYEPWLEQGVVALVIAVITDVTERSNATAALKMKQAHSQSLLQLARNLEQARTTTDILQTARIEVERTLGICSVWFYLFSEDRTALQLIVATKSSPAPAVPPESAGDMLLIKGDAMLEELAAANDIVVVEDARSDPRTNKQIVPSLGSRTIINMPVSMSGRKLGLIGAGTFGDEGVRVLSAAQREFFSALASHVAAVLDRVQSLEKRRQAEAALHENEVLLHAADRRLAEIMHGMTEACFALDSDWNFTFVNDRCQTLLRHRSEEMLGKPIWEVFRKLVGTPMESQYRRVMTERVTAAFEAFSPIAERWLDIRLFPTAEGLAAFLMDISERKEAEEKVHRLNVELEERVIVRTAELEKANAELRHSRAELQSFFESLPGLYLVLTPDFKIVAASDAYLKATMTTREGILGKGLFEVFPDNPDEPGATGEANLRASLQRVLEKGEAHTMAIQKYDVRRPDGVFEERYWSPINSPVVGMDRKIEYLIHRVEEVTEFVLSRASNSDISPEVSARMQLMEAEIFQSSQKVQAANRQLEAVNKELESFSYSVSHDLRAPLRAMDGFSRAVLEDYGQQLPADGLRYLQIIRTGAQRMGNLIDDLLSFSRLSRAALKKRTIDVTHLVREVLDEMHSQRHGRQIDLRIGELPACVGDPALLKQVWINLLSNAIKYTQKREAAVIEIGCTQEGGSHTYFVRDNGTGFDMRYAHKLFGVFQRLHRAEDYDGTGVGLAIVQRIIHRHGGKVWAEAAVDQGATFYFNLEGENQS